MVKLNNLCSYDVEDCYRAIRRLATGKKWTKHPNDDEDDDSEAVRATNELISRKKFFRNVETLNAAKQNVGEALAMAELSLMATSAYAESSNSRKPSRMKRLRHYGHFKFTKNTRTDKESKEDTGYFSRHSRGRTFERDACRDRVNRARSFQVRRSTSSEDVVAGRTSSTKAFDGQGQGRDIRRSASDRVRPQFNSLPRSSSAGASPSPVVKRRDPLKIIQANDGGKSAPAPDGRTRRPAEDTIVKDPDTGIKYKKGKLLGKGGFAKCFEFSDVKTKEKFAVKVVSKNRMANPRTREKIIREIEIHRQLEHPNVVTFYGFFESKGTAYLILENCVQRSMVHVLAKRKTLTEPEVRYFMLQLISGCRYIHGRKIIHRDLKLGNMLLDDQMKIKIADFGLATKVFFVGEKKTSLCGTPNYIAPEVLQKKGHSYEADIWALGCVMYTMLCGQPPFETKSLKETYHRIINAKFTTPGHVAQAAAQLMSKILNVEPESRPSLSRISADKFFLCGYTPSTLSTFCCHTAPRFALASTLERNRSLRESINKKSKQETQDNIRRTKSTQTKREEQIVSKTNEKQHQQPKKNNRKTTEATAETIISNVKPKQTDNALSTIAENELNLRTSEKTFRIIDIKSNIRSSQQNISLEKLMNAENYSLSINNTQSQHTSNDTKVGEMTEASFDHLFRLMKKTVEQFPNEGTNVPSSPSSSSSSSTSSADALSSSQSPLWITKWVDYSNKYGFGYQLSDGRIGILFSDSGHILLSPDRRSVNYTSRLDKSRSFSVENVPSKLQRKFLVVENLAVYMTEHLIRGGDLGGSETTGRGGDPVQGTTTSCVLLQKWYRDEDVILMQLNNGTLQVNYLKDHSKIILSRSSPNTGDYLLTYVCRGRSAAAWPLTNTTAVQDKIDPEVIERIRLALDLIDEAEDMSGEPIKRTDKASPPLKNKCKPSTGNEKENVPVGESQNRKDSQT